MKILVPHDRFSRCALALDLPELKLLRVRVVTTCERILEGRTAGLEEDQQAWLESPASLARYGIFLCAEYQHRIKSVTDPLMPVLWDQYHKFKFSATSLTQTALPIWLGDPDVHNAHRAELFHIDNRRYCWYRCYANFLK